MADYVKLHDPVTGNEIYPLTHPDAVRDASGVSVGSKIRSIEEALNRVSVPEATAQQINQLFETE